MRAVNLLPREVARDRTNVGRLPLLVAAGGVVGVTVVAAVLLVSASGSVGDRRSQLKSLQAAAARVSPARPAVATGAIAQERTDRIAALSAALSTRVPLDRLLRELALVIPEDAWLTGLTAAAPASATPVAGAPGVAATQGVTIQGATYSHESVARVLARLAAIPTLDAIRLAASARVEPTDQAGATPSTRGKTVVTFTINANLRTGSAT